MEIALRQNGNPIPIEMRLCFMRIKSLLWACCLLVRLLLGSKEARRDYAETDKRSFLFCRNRDVLVAFGISEERAGLALIEAEFPIDQNIAALSLAKILAAEFSHARTRWIGRIISESAKNRTHGMVGRVRRAARSVRSSVRQTFAARKAAKAADSGGGSSDPDGRRPLNNPNTCNALPVSAFLTGGAK